MFSFALSYTDEYASSWSMLANTLAASTLAWLKMAAEMTKMIKRLLVLLKIIFELK
jgi:hypothetical protein